MTDGEADEEPVEQVFEESVTAATEPFDTFDTVYGYEDTKARLRETVVEPAGYGRYGTSSVLLFGDSEQAPVTRLAMALTGAFGEGYTFFSVDTVSGGFIEDGTNVGATLQAARDRAPSVVVLDCLDEFAFDEEEYDRLRSHLDAVRADGTRVLVVATATDDDADLIDNDALFEFVVELPEPGERYRRSEIETALSAAREAGVVALDGGDWLDKIDTREVSLMDLRTAVKRAIQRRRDGADPPVTVRRSDVQSAIDEIDDERFEAAVEPGLFGHGAGDQQFEPDVPDTSFADVGGLDSEKRRLREAVTIPVEYSETFREAGYSVGQGILLHGPPGNGKTMLAKAVANELDYHFLSVKGPELEQPLVGESERELRELFRTAREHAPSVVFFDEFDSLAPDRASDTYEFKDDLVNTLLSELDGLEALEDVLVLAATNRLDRLDPAVLRSGRFDTFIEVPMPDAADRRAIFELHAAELPLADSVTAEWFETLSLPDLSGADIAAICRKALEFAVSAFDTGDRETLTVTRPDVLTAVEGLRTDSTTDDLPGFR